MGSVLPFPRTRDRAFVQRHAARMADLPVKSAERHLAHQLELQRRKMAERGIDPLKAAEQISALEVAIRCELGRQLLLGGVA